MRKFLIIAHVVLLGLTVVLPAAAEERVMSTEWYRAPENRQALEEKLAQCRGNPEQRAADKNCQNAESAAATSKRVVPTKEPAIPTF